MFDNEILVVSGALGESSPDNTIMRPMVGGPHEVGARRPGRSAFKNE